ncbi:CxxC motif-containing protein [Anaerocolumna jejuensis DSM 15929]|uniref:CxxC motif-containing protein n=1 Tax=Anaerocolumna jejuensis DSM 15929 TaxID=1121322 RepID=A0A1M6SX08_9FIRM|nr:DUF1667 domain-containing protein [Anaerocolumna jejuensis]SHK49216.1 CxxC motif-containing protein [Anaerocolumna jejuensis DSM 15929]
MEKRELICICCPLGCQMAVTIKDGKVIETVGNTCNRGKIYGEKEIINPTRIVTSTVKVDGGEKPYVSVKTKEDIPKSKIFECMKGLQNLTVKAPIYIGDIILDNAGETGIPIIATSNVLVK